MDEVAASGLTPGLIAGLLCQGRPAILRFGEGSHRLALIDYDTFFEGVVAGVYPTARLRVTYKDGLNVPPIFYRSGDGIDRAKLNHLLENGASLIAYGAEAYFPSIAKACSVLGDELDEHVEAAVVVSTGVGGALKVHFDKTDLVAVQVEGAKRWKAYRDPVANPTRAQIAPPARPKPGDPLAIDEPLQAGDVLFLPTGYWHHCENGAGRSMHVAFQFFPLSEERVFALLERDALVSSPGKGSRPSGQTRQARFEDLKRRLMARVDAISAEDLYRSHLREFSEVRHGKPDKA